MTTQVFHPDSKESAGVREGLAGSAQPTHRSAHELLLPRVLARLCRHPSPRASTGAGETRSSLFSPVTDDFTCLSLPYRTVCNPCTIGQYTGVNSKCHSPFAVISHLVFFRQSKRSSLAQELLFPSTQHPISARNSFQLWLAFPSSTFQALPKRALVLFSASQRFFFVVFFRGVVVEGNRKEGSLNTQKCRDTLDEKQSLSPPHTLSQRKH